MFVGKRVNHRKWGIGTVHHVGPKVIAVTFDCGTIAGVWRYELRGIH